VIGLAKEVIAGLAGGLVGAGLMKITAPPPTISSNKETIPRQSVGAGGSATLKPSTTYKFAIILFHGDGDNQVRIDVTKGAVTESIRGNEQAIEILANESISITAENTDTGTPRYAPTIEILSLEWS
jgi:hypothetical protein